MAEQPEGKPAGQSSGEPPTAGARLREARIGKGLTIREAALELHLDCWLVEALEGDDYATFGAPVFAKGHLRQYADLLGLPADDMLIAYYQAQGVTDVPPLTSSPVREAPALRRAVGVKGVGIAIGAVLVMAAGAWWFSEYSPRRSAPLAQPETGNAAATVLPEPRDSAPPQAPPAATPDAEVAQDTPDPDGSEAVDSLEPSARVESATTEETGSAAPNVDPVRALSEPTAGAIAEAGEGALVPEAEASQASAQIEDDEIGAAAAEGLLEIELRFSADSWVEVYDGLGRRLMYDLGRGGRSRTLAGVAPIEVKLGDSSVVEIMVDGAPYAVPRATRQGQVVRLNIEAPASGE